MLTTVPQQDTGYLDQSQIVGALFLITHQKRYPALRKPAQRPLHYPSPRRITFLTLRVFLLFADLADVRGVAVTLYHFPSRLFVVALVQAQVLRRLIGGFVTLDDDGINLRAARGSDR
jgi:hypothetical protein